MDVILSLKRKGGGRMGRQKISKKIKELMLNLYKKGLGTVRISKKLGISKTAIRNNLLKMYVKFRKAPKDKIGTNLHKKFVELYKKELSMKKIAQRHSVSFSTVRRHLHRERIELKKRGDPKIILNQNYHKLTQEKAYILGVIGPGDGFIEYRNDNGVYRIVLEATNLDFVKYFILCLEKTYGLKAKIKKISPRNFGINPTFIARLSSKEVCDDLIKYKVSFREKDWGVPQLIKNSAEKIKAKYIEGFADSQGCVYLSKTQKQVILSSQNINGLEEIRRLLEDIRIQRINQGKNGIVLSSKKSIEVFSRKINFNIPYKQDKFKKLIEHKESIKSTTIGK